MIQSINWIYIPNSAEKLIKTIFLPKKHKLHGLISWIKVYKLHKRKNLDKCHIWTSFIKFDPTSKSRKTWFLYLTFMIRPPEYKANSHFGTIFFKETDFFNVSIYGIFTNCGTEVWSTSQCVSYRNTFYKLWYNLFKISKFSGGPILEQFMW